MILILEGTDCCFKTTVAEKLSQRLGYPVTKGSSFELSTSGNEALFNHFKNQTRMNNVIIDRSIYSNLTYASLYNDYSIITQEQKLIIEDLLEKKATVIYLTASEETIKNRMSVRGDEYVENSMIGKIVDKYKEVMSDCNLSTLTYDTEIYSSDEIVESILKVIK